MASLVYERGKLRRRPWCCLRHCSSSLLKKLYIRATSCSECHFTRGTHRPCCIMKFSPSLNNHLHGSMPSPSSRKHKRNLPRQDSQGSVNMIRNNRTRSLPTEHSTSCFFALGQRCNISELLMFQNWCYLVLRSNCRH